MKRTMLSLTLLAVLLVFGSTMTAGANIPKLGWPVAKNTVTLPFGGNWPFASSCTNLAWKHTGIDIRAKKGDSVYAGEAGTVQVSLDSGGPWKDWITVEHQDTKKNKYTTTYWHLKNRKVVRGNTIKKGQKIAEVADMGGNTHSHFSVYNGAYSNTANHGGLPVKACGTYSAYPASFVNPLNYLN